MIISTLEDIVEDNLEVYGPDAAGVIEAHADEFVPLTPALGVQRRVRDGLRTRLSALPRRPGSVLVATFGGRLPVGADVENHVLFNIGGKLAAASAEGVQFEHLSGPPLRSRTGRNFRYYWRY